MYTITFYSFKGGVGRTLALVNVAAQLAKMGRKVLLVDFDLEAPGLETFDQLRPKQPHPGMVEYVTEYVRSKHSPDVRDYVYSAGTVGQKGGQLWVMPAGRRDASYQAALVRIDWKRLYRDCDGFLFFEDTKKQWEQELKPDYVLIDSRTGHTDVEGICTRQLPDAVVAMFFPNEQNLVGLKDVCQQIRHESWTGLKKRIKLHFVMSNVPDLDDEDQILHKRIQAFHKVLGIDELAAVVHRYESAHLFNQAVFTLDRPRSRLALEYHQLVQALITENRTDRDGALRFLHEYAQSCLPTVARDIGTEVNRKLGVEEPGLPASGVLPRPGARKRAHPRFEEKDPLSKIVGNFLDDGEVLLQAAQCRTLEGDLAGALALLNRIHKLQPNLVEVLFERAMCKNQLGDPDGATTDLLAYLSAPALERRNVLRALRMLQWVAPDRVLQASALPAFQVFTDSDLFGVCRLLGNTKAGCERCVDIIRQLIAQPTPGDVLAWPRDQLPLYLMGARRWREAIELFMDNADSHDFSDLFYLAIAVWAESGNFSVDRFQLVVAKDEYGDMDIDSPGMKCWVLWGIGKGPEALHLLERDVEQVQTHVEPLFSFWRCRWVPLATYLEDCEQLRRMIQGEPIRPAFLDESPAGEPEATR